MHHRSVLLLIALFGCSRSSGTFALDDGTEVIVHDAGIELAVDGEVGFALGGTPQARTFEETWTGPFAIYSFERDDESRIDLEPTRVRRDGEAVVVEYAAEDSHTAELRVEPSEAGTAFTLTVDGDADSIAVPVRCDDGGSFHGFGEQYSATNLKGHAFTVMVEEQGLGRDGSDAFFSGDAYTTYFPMPWWLDARGHGVLFHTEHRVEADVCATNGDLAWIEVVSDAPVRWTVFHGPEPLDVVRQLGDVVGRPALPPDWAFGTWICTQGGEQAVRDQAEFLDANDIEVSALWVQDWTGTSTNIGGGYGVNYRWEADTDVLYPGLGQLIDDLHDRDLRVLVYVNSFIDSDLPNHFDEMEAAGMLPQTEDGETYTWDVPRNGVTVADFTNPDTRDYAREALVDAITTWGVDGWMADFGEWLPVDAVLHDDGIDPMVAHNRYPIDWHTVVREAMDEARPDGDFVTFARSGFTGVQDVAQIHWVGDQQANDHATDGLPTVVPAMLTLSMSGQPHVTHDIAGFSGGPSTKELYLRWTELGAFTPFMRTHDGNAREDNWRFDSDAETTAHFRRFSGIHDALAPELRAAAEAAQSDSAPIVRHLMLEWPDDPETWDIDDQYLLADTLLVAPVLTTGTTEREVYLPAGTWFDVWTGEELAGGQWVTREAPVGSPPVFSRDEDRTDLRAVP